MQNILKLNGVQQLTKTQQKKVTGGLATFTCFCGFVGSEGVDQTNFSVSASSIGSALNEAGSLCGGWGATCSGDQELSDPGAQR